MCMKRHTKQRDKTRTREKEGRKKGRRGGKKKNSLWQRKRQGEKHQQRQ